MAARRVRSTSARNSGADLLGQDLADQRAEPFDVLAQQAIGGRELEVAQGFVGGFGKGRAHPAKPTRCF